MRLSGKCDAEKVATKAVDAKSGLPQLIFQLRFEGENVIRCQKKTTSTLPEEAAKNWKPFF